MRELRTLNRPRDGTRVRSVQGRLSISFGDEDEAGGEVVQTESPARNSGFRRPVRPASPGEARAAAVRIKTPTPVFHPLAYRSVVADWPIHWRERWGRRANALEETGLGWRDAETQAFVELWHELRLRNQEPARTSPMSSILPGGSGEGADEGPKS